MYKIPANTLFLGKRLVFVPDCHSTNTLALQLAQKAGNTEGTVVITNHQTAGRGQHGNRWESAPNLNLTFSMILNPHFLAPDDQYYLTIVTSLAVHDYLMTQTGHDVSIKWPNDILVHEKKISGILIENQIQGNRLLTAVAGIGLNVNQVEFETPSATSLRALVGQEIGLETAFHELLGCLEGRFLQLRQLHFGALKADYLSRLYRINEKHPFASRQKEFEGTIRGISPQGRLIVETDGGVHEFGIKEIQFLR